MDHIVLGMFSPFGVSAQVSGSDADGPTFEMMHCIYIYMTYSLGNESVSHFGKRKIIDSKALFLGAGMPMQDPGWKISKTITSILP